MTSDVFPSVGNQILVRRILFLTGSYTEEILPLCTQKLKYDRSDVECVNLGYGFPKSTATRYRVCK